LQSPRFVHRTITRLSVPQALQTILLNCLEEPRESRIQTAREFLKKLESLQETQKGEVKETSRQTSSWFSSLFGQKDSPKQPTSSTQKLPETPAVPRAEVKESPPPQPIVSIQPGQVFQDKLKDGSLGPKVVWLPKGKFKMGGDGYGDEKPIHEVTIGYEFGVGQYQVTVGEFKKFVQATGYKTEAETGGGAYVLTGSWEKKADANWKNPYFAQNDSHPVVCVSWNDAKKYVAWLSEQTGKKYRLLSEAEWEYACRAGSAGKYCFGDDVNQLGNYGWYNANSGSQTHPVGEKQSNKFGLYDMHGNVWEWCEDVWHENYTGAPSDGSAWVSGGSNAHLLRGGSWGFNDIGVRCADRYRHDTTDRYSGGGLRFSRM